MTSGRYNVGPLLWHGVALTWDHYYDLGPLLRWTTVTRSVRCRSPHLGDVTCGLSGRAMADGEVEAILHSLADVVGRTPLMWHASAFFRRRSERIWDSGCTSVVAWRNRSVGDGGSRGASM